MGLAAITRSSDFSAFILFFLIAAVFYQLNCSCFCVYGFLGVSLFYLHSLFGSKKIEGGAKIKVVVIGAGMSGLNAAKKLKEAGVSFVVLEKASQLGGTWWFNQYPGAACDVPSHLYSLSHFMNPWWSKAYSGHAEIENYLLDFAKEFDLLKYIKFNCRVTKSDWSESSHKWTVTTESGEKHEAHFVWSAIGALHTPFKPTFKGQEQFKGTIVHTAEWKSNISLKGKRVAVIGTGASAVQVVPSIAGEVKQLTVFQRTPCWAPSRGDYKFPAWLKQAFSIFPPLMLILRWFIFWRAEFRFHIIFNKNRSFLTGIAKYYLEKEMRQMVTNPAVADKLIPKYDIGCKRVTPSDTYLKAFNRSNIELVTDSIECFTSKGVKVKNGKEFQADVIILATGFSIMESCRSFSVKGRSGKILSDQWKDEPKLYLGTAMPDFPNLFFLLGPGTGLGHNSIIYVIECQTNYAIDSLKKLVMSGFRSMDTRVEKYQQFGDLVSTMMKDRVFRGGGGCTAWYQNERGVNWTLWPGDLSYFWWLTRKCNMEDYVVR